MQASRACDFAGSSGKVSGGGAGSLPAHGASTRAPILPQARAAVLRRTLFRGLLRLVPLFRWSGGGFGPEFRRRATRKRRGRHRGPWGRGSRLPPCGLAIRGALASWLGCRGLPCPFFLVVAGDGLRLEARQFRLVARRPGVDHHGRHGNSLVGEERGALFAPGRARPTAASRTSRSVRRRCLRPDPPHRRPAASCDAARTSRRADWAASPRPGTALRPNRAPA